MTNKSVAMEKQRQSERKVLWPDIDDSMIWHRKTSKGFTTIPRVLPYFMRILDNLSPGKPVSATYFTLWCSVYDEAYTKLDAEEMSYASGFSGERATTPWRQRIGRLKELGFIDVKESGSSSYALLLNPFKVIKTLYEKGEVNQSDYSALAMRAIKIGAKDLDPEIPKASEVSDSQRPRYRLSFQASKLT